jgi:hypothetical protein
MKLRFLLFMMALVMAFSQELQAQNVRLLILRPSGTVTHQWVYMPSGEIVTQQGLQNKQYPLQKLPSETYLESELIAIEGCDLGLTVRHYVSTKRTHPIKIELIDETNDVLYSFVNEGAEVNTSTMTTATDVAIGVLEGASKAKIRASLSDAYSDAEAIDILELELYSKNGSGVDEVESRIVKVTAEPQHLIIESDIVSLVQIYSISGMLVKENAICAGTNRIELSSGFYLLNLSGKTYKVIVP